MIALEAGDEITTPFTDTLGDNIRLYMLNAHDGRLVITGDGNTLNNLDLMGINVAAPTSQTFIQEALHRSGVSLIDDCVLQVISSIEDRDAMSHRLIQAILDIDRFVISDKK